MRTISSLFWDSTPKQEMECKTKKACGITDKFFGRVAVTFQPPMIKPIHFSKDYVSYRGGILKEFLGRYNTQSIDSMFTERECEIIANNMIGYDSQNIEKMMYTLMDDNAAYIFSNFFNDYNLSPQSDSIRGRIESILHNFFEQYIKTARSTDKIQDNLVHYFMLWQQLEKSTGRPYMLVFDAYLKEYDACSNNHKNGVQQKKINAFDVGFVTTYFLSACFHTHQEHMRIILANVLQVVSELPGISINKNLIDFYTREKVEVFKDPFILLSPCADDKEREIKKLQRITLLKALDKEAQALIKNNANMRAVLANNLGEGENKSSLDKFEEDIKLAIDKLALKYLDKSMDEDLRKAYMRDLQGSALAQERFMALFQTSKSTLECSRSVK